VRRRWYTTGRSPNVRQGASMSDTPSKVHQTHCCKYHDCKFDEEDCPVINCEVEQEYPCEHCPPNALKKLGNLTFDEAVELKNRVVTAIENELLDTAHFIVIMTDEDGYVSVT